MEHLLTNGYTFTEDWFSHVQKIWRELFYEFKPSRFLEIGSFEGRSACFIIDQLASHRPIEIQCIDTWQGGIEHRDLEMGSVEARFDDNLSMARTAARLEVQFTKHKTLSVDALARLLVDGRGEYFDFIYIDGSHQAPDVLTDAVLAFQLLSVRGILVFDDYAWSIENDDFYQLPKPAIDAFVNIYRRKLKLIQQPLYQLYVQKTAS